ncbi:MAG: glycosyltransferase family 2 protein [Candidatus Curtissbacteria bacterium]|nr:glycosyltransferase family 2 protein [Candidatus Berkelbacteria bacterium]MCR4324806.1 glycosyltransferase family 2 protein [Candidatus Curtissbacteria bacterium]
MVLVSFLVVVAWVVWAINSPVAALNVLAVFVVISFGFNAIARLTFTSLSLFARKRERWPVQAYPAKAAILVSARNDPSIFQALPSVLRVENGTIDYKVLVLDDSTDPDLVARLVSIPSSLFIQQGPESNLQEISRRINETDHALVVIHRTNPVGGKAGAINNAVRILRWSEVDYIALLDADHHVAPDFLKRGIAASREYGGPVAGWQPHRLGAYRFLGTFVNVNWAITAMEMQARQRMGLAPIFGGSAGIFPFGWLYDHPFDETSITEDWELSLQAYLRGEEIPFREDLAAVGIVPANFASFRTQQRRWAEGTIRDFRHEFWKILSSRRINWRTKLGLVYQGLLWTQTLGLAASIAVVSMGAVFPWFNGASIPTAVTLGAWGFFTLAHLLPVAVGGKVEGLRTYRNFRNVVFSLLMLFVMLPDYLYATLRGLFLEKADWVVTKKLGSD